jgi:hypothetical protein
MNECYIQQNKMTTHRRFLVRRRFRRSFCVSIFSAVTMPRQLDLQNKLKECFKELADCLNSCKNSQKHVFWSCLEMIRRLPCIGFPSQEDLLLCLKTCNFANHESKLKTRAFKNKLIGKPKVGIACERANAGCGNFVSCKKKPNPSCCKHRGSVSSREIELTVKNFPAGDWKLHVVTFERLIPSTPGSYPHPLQHRQHLLL